MAVGLAFLEEAISDVGLWSWWTADLPEMIQIEFNGTLLWNPPLKESGPPNGQIALRFLNPSFVGFLTRHNQNGSIPQDWPQRMRNDQMKSFNLAPDDFTLSDADRLLIMASNASRVETLVGDATDLATVPSDAGLLGFWSGPVGLIVVAQKMQIHGYNGQISLEEAEAANRKWWDYWKEYWQRKDTNYPMPQDYACEVTIPSG